jgi:hypothetical protein
MNITQAKVKLYLLQQIIMNIKESLIMYSIMVCQTEATISLNWAT